MLGWYKQISALLLATALSPPVWSRCDFEQAITHFNQSDYIAAQPLFLSCLEENSEAAQSSFYLGLIARQAKQLTLARQYLQKAADWQPESLNYSLELAVTYEWSSDLLSAIRIYETVLSQDSENFPARLGLARLLHWRGYLRQSRAAYAELKQQYPDHPAVLNGLAHALLADGDLNAARDLFNTVLGQNPESQTALDGLEMLSKVKKHSIQIDTGYSDLADGNSNKEYQLSYAWQANYAWRWGASISQRDSTVTQPNNIGIPENRAIQSIYSLSAGYRYSAQTMWQFGYDTQNLNDGDWLHRIRLGYNGFNGSHSWDISATPSLLNGDFVNSLQSVGYGYQWVNSSINARLFYAFDKEFSDSQSFSINWQQNFKSGAWYSAGGSVGRFERRQSYNLFVTGSYPLTQQLSVRASVIADLTNNQLRISSGLSYAF